ncbi:hypothetical protein B296_00039047 [Ensete ventricosum]|uniref:Uncharacterized protein n=1 Tax=Ensete ventricosum TaxID=4639 RepID=A0A426YKM0_ENSVE|nr:hypothetical protein B296_00039047 [Ensete ventricosum]
MRPPLQAALLTGDRPWPCLATIVGGLGHPYMGLGRGRPPLQAAWPPLQVLWQWTTTPAWCLAVGDHPYMRPARRWPPLTRRYPFSFGPLMKRSTYFD